MPRDDNGAVPGNADKDHVASLLSLKAKTRPFQRADHILPGRA